MNSYNTKEYLNVNGKRYAVHSLKQLTWSEKLPYSLKILLENVLRNENGKDVTKEHVVLFEQWLETASNPADFEYNPSRVLMQDFTGVPAVVDLAAMRDAMSTIGTDPEKINPLTQVDLVIDHSVIVDFSGNEDAFKKNVELEFKRNAERYAFLKWGQTAFKHFRVVPPGTGICHQVNLEYLADVVSVRELNEELWVFPDTVIGTDSHTTMINGLGVLGWGVGGIEAEATMLGLGMSMTLPDVIGFNITGTPRAGITATDIVLTITQMLRSKGVVEKFVEFYGEGVSKLSLPDRATISNMAPEYGATCGYFPIDGETIRFLRLSGRSDDQVALVEAYAKEVGLWRSRDDLIFTDTLHLDLSTVEACVAGPKRPQDRVLLSQVPDIVTNSVKEIKEGSDGETKLTDGDVVIAAITSCTNTSNPSVMLGAGLLAKKAVEKGLSTKPWVKTSLAPGSQVVKAYFDRTNLTPYLDQLGFHVVGYGCTTCIGNSGPLSSEIANLIDSKRLDVAAVLSGNRNFEGRVHPQVKLSFLASPMLVVAYALAGHTRIHFETDPIGTDKEGNPVFLKDIWPTHEEIQQLVEDSIDRNMFQTKYADVFEGSEEWKLFESPSSKTYSWDSKSTYIQHPPYFEGFSLSVSALQPIQQAKILAVFGDSITTDHISPAGNIRATTPAGLYLLSKGVPTDEFNSYGARRGNHNIMMRGTFANIRIQNELTPDVQGGFALDSAGNQTSIYEAAMDYKQKKVPLIIVAGKEYGTGSSRDWAAKGTNLLGVKVVVAESFERIHRSNLVGMGVLPVTFMNGMTRHDLELTGSEYISFDGIESIHKPNEIISMFIQYEDGQYKTIQVQVRLKTETEIDYFRHGGILPYVIRTKMV